MPRWIDRLLGALSLRRAAPAALEREARVAEDPEDEPEDAFEDAAVEPGGEAPFDPDAEEAVAVPGAIAGRQLPYGFADTVLALVCHEDAVFACGTRGLHAFDARLLVPRARREDVPAESALSAGGRLLVGTVAGTVEVLDPRTLATVASTRLSDQPVAALASDGGPTFLAAVSGENVICELDLGTLASIARFPAGEGLPLGLVAGAGMAGVGDEEAIYWRIDRTRKTPPLRRRIGNAESYMIDGAAMSGDGRRIAVFANGAGELLEAATLAPLATLSGHACVWPAGGPLLVLDRNTIRCVGPAGETISSFVPRPGSPAGMVALAIDHGRGPFAVLFDDDVLASFPAERLTS